MFPSKIILATLTALLSFISLCHAEAVVQPPITCTTGTGSLNDVRDGQCQVYGNEVRVGYETKQVYPAGFNRNNLLVFKTFSMSRSFQGNQQHGPVVVRGCEPESSYGSSEGTKCQSAAFQIKPYSNHEVGIVSVVANISVQKRQRKIARDMMQYEYSVGTVPDPVSANEVGNAICGHLGMRWSPAEGSILEIIKGVAPTRSEYDTAEHEAILEIYPETIEGKISSSSSSYQAPSCTLQEQYNQSSGKYEKAWQTNFNQIGYRNALNLVSIRLSENASVASNVRTRVTSEQRFVSLNEKNKQCGDALKNKTTRLMPVSSVTCLER